MTPHHNKHHHAKKRKQFAVERVEMFFLTDEGQDLQKNMMSQIGDPDAVDIEPFPHETEGFASETIIFCLRNGELISESETIVIPINLEEMALEEALEEQLEAESGENAKSGSGLEQELKEMHGSGSEKSSSEEPELKEA